MGIVTQLPIITVTLNPALDHTLLFSKFHIGQLNRVESERIDPGGKGINVAKVIKALGHEVTVTGFLGLDNAAVFEKYFNMSGIQDCFVKLNGSTRVNIKIVEESGDLSEINFPGINCTVEDLARLTCTIEKLAETKGIFVLAGSLPQGVPGEIYGQYVKLLQNYGCKVFLDTSGEALAEGIKAKPYAIKPNISELSQLIGRSLETEADIKAVVDELLAGGIEQVTISLGARGALIANKHERLLARPPRVQVKSAVGAGDAMVAGLAASEARNLPIGESIRLATATAVASVIQPGTQVCSIKDVEKIIPQVSVEKFSV